MATDIKDREKVETSYWTFCCAEGCCGKYGKDDLEFKDASRRLGHELDICEVIKTIRVSRLLAKTQTTS